MPEFWIYLLILSGSTYLIRALPFTLMREKIKNRRVRAFFHYIPYAVLAAMTVPSVFYATTYPLAAILGFAVAVLVALFNKSMTVAAILACLTVGVTEAILALL